MTLNQGPVQYRTKEINVLQLGNVHLLRIGEICIIEYHRNICFQYMSTFIHMHILLVYFCFIYVVQVTFYNCNDSRKAMFYLASFYNVL